MASLIRGQTDRKAIVRGQANYIALEWYGAGLKIAGALHLAFASGGNSLATFDAKLARRARKLDGAPQVVVP
jgi:hypothetical protein